MLTLFTFAPAGLAGGPAGPCCFGGPGSGCENSGGCETCVCTTDPYCCTTVWDGHCANAAAGSCSDVCGCGCTDPFGDITGDGEAKVVDVQCFILLVLSALSGNPDVPTCLGTALADADLQCDGQLDITDVQLVIGAALKKDLDPGLDTDGNNCPDECGAPLFGVCFGPDGSPCDDGNRCTVGDSCTAGSCSGGTSLNCDDSEPCTTDTCDPKLGCQHELILGCGDNCTGSEIPNDGFDSDCDGFELFGPNATPLQLSGPIGANPFSVALSGTMPLGLFGLVPVSGTAVRAVQNGPVSWCVQGTFAGNVQALTLLSAGLKLCYLPNGTYNGTLDGTLKDGQSTVNTSGSFTVTGVSNVILAVSQLTSNAGLVIHNVNLTAQAGQTILTGTAVFDDGAFSLSASGNYASTGPLSLPLVIPPNLPPYTPFPNLALSIHLIGGTLDRSAAGWSATLVGETDPVTLASGMVLDVANLSLTFSSTGITTNLGGLANLGFTTLNLSGSLNKTAATSAMTGCLGGSTTKTIGGLYLDPLNFSYCPGDAAANVSGELLFEGQMVAFVGTVVTGNPWTVTLQLEDLTLAPGLELSETTLTTSGAGYVLSGILTIGEGSQTLNLAFTGNWAPTGNWVLQAGMAPGTQWTPVVGLDLAVTQLSGTVSKTNGNLSISVTGGSTAPLVLVPGLVLTGVSVTGNWSAGLWSVVLAGSIHIDLGSNGVDVMVMATISDQPTLEFGGEITEPIAPLEPWVGDAFIIDDIALVLAVDLTTDTFSLTFSADAEFCLFTPCSPSDVIVFTVEAGLILDGTTWGFYFRGDLDPIDIPVLGTLDLTFVATTIDLQGFDVFDTPNDENDDLDLEAGVHLAGVGPCPLSFDGTTVPLLYLISVSGLSVSVEAEIPVNWTVISPEAGFPGIEELTLDKMTLGGTLDPITPSVFIGGQATFQPSNQNEPLIGTGEIGLGLGPSVALSMEVLLLGRWLDMFGLVRFAIQNPGFALTIVGSAPPVPTAMGISTDIFWLKTGPTWPSETAWPVPTEAPGPNDPPPPPQVAQLGGTFFYDVTPTPSGLCLLGFCAPLPTLIFRAEANALSFPWDLVNILADFSAALANALPGAFPLLNPPNLDLSPLTVELTHLALSASTHNKEQFGLSYSAGLFGNLIMDVYGTEVGMSGFADTAGILFEGTMEAVDLLGLGVVQFSGNPYSKTFLPKGSGTLQLADAVPLEQPTSTFEGWVRSDSWGTGELDQRLVYKLGSTNGFAIGFGNAVSGKGKVTVKLRSAGKTYTISTATGVMEPKKLTHVAVGIQNASVVIYVDGVRQNVVAVGQPTAAGDGTVPMVIGEGLTQLDDVRMWKVLRTPAAISGHKRILPDGYTDDPNLVFRYEFDFDTAGGNVAHNTRYRPTGDKLHATVMGTGEIAEEIHEPMWVKLSLRAPGPAPGEEGAGFWLKAGARFGIPFLNWEIGAAANFAIGEGTAFGSFYAPDFPLLPIPEVGTLIAGGYGPNLVPADFDDGLYGDIDLLQGSFSVTGKLSWEEPDGDEQIIGGAAISFGCPTQTGCEPYIDSQLEIIGDMDLTIDPFGLGAIGVTGDCDIVLNSPDWNVDIEGDVVIFDLEFFSVSVEMNEKHLKFSAIFDFGELEILGVNIDLGGILMAWTFAFDTWELCGQGSYQQDPNDEVVKGFVCGVSLCIGGPDWPITPSLGCGGFCLGSEFCFDDEICYFGYCTPKKPLGSPCGADNHCKSDHCGCIVDDGLLGVSAGICYKEASKEMGEDCKVDAECITNRCSAELCVTGHCVCDDNNDCGPNQWCDQGDPLLGIGTNVCKPLKDDGVTCTSSERCKSGHCSTESDLDPCGYCYTPNSGDAGDACRVNAECKSDQCGYVCGAPGFGKCKCNTDLDCGLNQYCGGGNNCNPQKADCSTCDADNKCLSGVCTASVLGTCITPNSATLGQSCCHDDECVVGKCGSDGLCQCTEDFHCGDNQYCAKNGLNQNECTPKKNECETCDADRKCKSDYCTAAVLGTCVTTNSKTLGAACCHDDQCTTNRCGGNGTCECTTDSHCGANKYCALNGLNGNSCEPKKAECETCDSDHKCLSNNCTAAISGKCVTEGLKNLGQSCCHNDQCAVGTCGANGLCVCQTDADCEDNQYCAENGLNSASCEPKKNRGESCSSDAQCKSDDCRGLVGLMECIKENVAEIGETCYANDECIEGTCGSSGECVCTMDSHCPSNQYCANPLLSNADCEPKKAECVTCDADNKCLSNHCTSAISGKCITPNSLNIGVSCCHNDQCKSDRCGPNGLCECDVNADCADNKYCADNGLNANTCEPKKADCETCDADYKCLSGECTASISGKCIDSNSKDVGQSCCHNDQCIGSQTCQSGSCRCTLDSHCDDDEYCSTPVVGTNSCIEKKSLGDSCDADRKCKSGCCKGGFIGIGQTCQSASECN
ncbi:MAG: hypothetical protein HUU55_18935 [Myxococcales bacterium]|nr:hypothetical protein [Myxococcales bacterium]